MVDKDPTKENVTLLWEVVPQTETREREVLSRLMGQLNSGARHNETDAHIYNDLWRMYSETPEMKVAQKQLAEKEEKKRHEEEEKKRLVEKAKADALKPEPHKPAEPPHATQQPAHKPEPPKR
jgi:hypothetical protein